jgi:hypothetical protein
MHLMRRDYTLSERNVLEKPLGFIVNKENAFSRKCACVKWKYLLACGSDRELR